MMSCFLETAAADGAGKPNRGRFAEFRARLKRALTFGKKSVSPAHQSAVLVAQAAPVVLRQQGVASATRRLAAIEAAHKADFYARVGAPVAREMFMVQAPVGTTPEAVVDLACRAYESRIAQSSSPTHEKTVDLLSIGLNRVIRVSTSEDAVAAIEAAKKYATVRIEAIMQLPGIETRRAEWDKLARKVHGNPALQTMVRQAIIKDQERMAIVATKQQGRK